VSAQLHSKAIIGALVGHIVMGITPSYLSVFGMLALAGVAVNDALVLVDYINRRCRQGAPLREAVMEAGAKRFRPIVLTSATTFVGCFCRRTWARALPGSEIGTSDRFVLQKIRSMSSNPNSLAILARCV
jgi:Cu/Ag efflux pump CusA